MKLNLKERISMFSLCPTEGTDIITQTLVRDILKKVELSQEEIKKINLRPQENGKGVQWDEPNVLPLKNVTFSELEIGLLKSRVAKLDEEKKVSHRILSLCLKIAEEKLQTKGESRRKAKK